MWRCFALIVGVTLVLTNHVWAEWSYRGWSFGQGRVTVQALAKSKGLLPLSSSPLDDPNISNSFTLKGARIFVQFFMCQDRLWGLSESQSLTAAEAADKLRAEQLTRGRPEVLPGRLSTLYTWGYPDVTVLVNLSRNDFDDARPVGYSIGFHETVKCPG